MAAFASIDLNCRRAGFANARGVIHGLLIAFYNRAGDALVQAFKGFRQQGSFAGAGAGHQIKYQLVVRGETCAVACGELVVFVQHVDLDFQHFALAHPRRMGASFAVAVVQVAFG
ncbi:hypothetical protein D3C86_1875830 [compost metagenome]